MRLLERAECTPGLVNLTVAADLTTDIKKFIDKGTLVSERASLCRNAFGWSFCRHAKQWLV
jgi:hypothetical protein